MSDAIRVQSLTKIYKGNNPAKDKLALQGLELSIPEGTIFGLLGPNGAGKSTLINILAGTVIKTSGLVHVLGYDIDLYPKQARSCIGIVPQEIIIDSFFPLGEALEFAAGYYGLRPHQRRTDEILKALSLYDKKDALPRALSGGMKRRYLIARAMVHSPKILVLDEPTAGVDIELRQQLWEYVKMLNNQGVTIIITTHYLEEAQELCDHIAFINQGQIIKQDTKANLMQDLGERRLYIEFESEVDASWFSDKNLFFDAIAPNKFCFYFNAKEQNFSLLLSEIQKINIAVKDIQMNQADLEDIFKKLIYNS